jgi:hypothetical protein
MHVSSTRTAEGNAFSFVQVAQTNNYDSCVYLSLCTDSCTDLRPNSVAPIALSLPFQAPIYSLWFISVGIAYLTLTYTCSRSLT